LLRVLIAGLIGFVGNKVVAAPHRSGWGAGSDPRRWSSTMFRGRGARVTSVPVVPAWVRIWLELLPLDDRIVGLIICIAILYVGEHRLRRWALGP